MRSYDCREFKKLTVQYWRLTLDTFYLAEFGIITQPSFDTEPKDISQLLSLAKERVGTKITLGESLLILQACGLKDQDEYNQAQQLATDIREWVNIWLTEEKHTIEVKAHKTFEEQAKRRALEIAITKLNQSQQWIEAEQKRFQLRSQRSQQFKLNLIDFARWIASGWSGWSIYLISLGIFTSLAFTFGVNFPPFVACPNTKSYCYLLRWDKTKVVIPSDYIKQSSQNDSKRKR